MKKSLVGLCLSVMMLTACTPATSSNSTSAANTPKYPEKVVTFVAPSGAGGAFDTALRVMSKTLAEQKLVTTQLLVENKPGGGGSVFLGEYVAKDSKNDYKLFLTSPVIIVNHLKSEGNDPYTYTDTTPIASLFVDYSVIAVSEDSPYKDLQSLINDLKADPKKLTIAGGSAPGSVDHLSVLLPLMRAGVDVQSIKYMPYDGKAEAMTSLLGKNADVLSSVTASVSEYLASGKIRVLAVNAPNRLGGAFKDVPTLKEIGIENAEFEIWRGIFGPKEMSKEATDFWGGKLKELSDNSEWQKVLTANSWEKSYRNSADFTKLLDEQSKTLAELLKAVGMAKE